MDILGIIPARYASTRFPGKPLADIGGRTMIQRVYEQSRKASCLKEVVVATDDERILEHVRGFGGEAMMTAATHASGTERCSEALTLWRKAHPGDWDAVINIQGDEPFIDPGQIELLGGLLAQPQTDICTLVIRTLSSNDLSDPNVVKVVLNRYGEALYFSRSPIPHFRGIEPEKWTGMHTYFKHVGIYGYKSDILERLPTLEPSPLEMAESLEQLRWLSYGLRIKTAVTEFESMAIDTPLDLLKITNIT